MDKLIYTAMSGAKMLTQRQETIAHNLANVSTNGFRAKLTAFRAVPLAGPGMPSRVASVETSVGADFTPGQLRFTGNPLDMAIQGPGFFAVQTPDGREGYTRDGAFMLSPEGTLQDRSGRPVMGEGGPITIPAGSNIMVGRDGTLTAVSTTDNRASAVTLGKLKVVNPEEGALERGGDGLFRMRDGTEADPDAAVLVAGQTLEGSNVSAVEALVGMIAVGRQFEQQMKLLQSAEQNAQRANQLLSVSS